MSRYAKTIAALLAAIGTWGVTAFDNGSATSAEWFGLIIALGGVFAVWAVPNSPPEGEPADPDVSERDR